MMSIHHVVPLEPYSHTRRYGIVQSTTQTLPMTPQSQVVAVVCHSGQNSVPLVLVLDPGCTLASAVL